MNTGAHVPLRIDVRREAGEMEIAWKDGRTDRIPLAGLRRFCPCALCGEYRERRAQEADGLHMLTPEEERATAEVQGVVPVGRYAIQIRWADGHDTGIYTYDYLRRLASELAELS